MINARVLASTKTTLKLLCKTTKTIVLIKAATKPKTYKRISFYDALIVCAPAHVVGYDQI